MRAQTDLWVAPPTKYRVPNYPAIPGVQIVDCGASWESGEKIASFLHPASAESEHLEQVTSRTFLSERTISLAPDRLLVCYLANADFFPVVLLFTSAFAGYRYVLQKCYKEIFIGYWMEIVDMCVIDRYPEAKYEFAILTYKVLKWWRHKN